MREKIRFVAWIVATTGLLVIGLVALFTPD